MLTLVRSGLFLFAAIALAGNLAAEEWGTLKGRIVYDGKAPTPKAIDTSKDAACKVKLSEETLVVDPKGGIADAAVILRTKNVPVHPDYEKAATETVVLDNKDCHFIPHVAVVRLTQPVALKNSDPTGHNTNITPLINDGSNNTLAAGADPITRKFDTEEARPVKVACNIHPWMGAWLIVRKDPYAAVTKPDGTFEIKNLPAGKELEFQLWQESAGNPAGTYKAGKTDKKGNFKVKIKPGDNDLGDIKISKSLFK